MAIFEISFLKYKIQVIIILKLFTELKNIVSKSFYYISKYTIWNKGWKRTPAHLKHLCLGQEFFSLYGGLTSKRQKVPFFIYLPFFTILSDLQAVKSILKSKIWRFQWYIILVILIDHCLLVSCTVLVIFSVFWSRKRISRRKWVHLK